MLPVDDLKSFFVAVIKGSDQVCVCMIIIGTSHEKMQFWRSEKSIVKTGNEPVFSKGLLPQISEKICEGLPIACMIVGTHQNNERLQAVG